MFMYLAVNIYLTDGEAHQGNEPALRNLITSDEVVEQVSTALKEGYGEGELSATLNDKPIRGYWKSTRSESN